MGISCNHTEGVFLATRVILGLLQETLLFTLKIIIFAVKIHLLNQFEDKSKI